MKKFGKISAVILCVFLGIWSVFAIDTLAALANSAAPNWEWEGADHSGSLLIGDSIPVKVKSEELTFDIADTPEDYLSAGGSLADYKSSVTAKYLFENPEDEGITARMVFPMAQFEGYNVPSDYKLDTDWSRYSVKGGAAGQTAELEKKVRASYGRYYAFNLAEEIKNLSDDYMPLDNLTRDMPVKAYTLQISADGGLPSGLDIEIEASYTGTILTGDFRGMLEVTDESCTLYDYIYGSDDTAPKNYTVYVAGENASLEFGNARFSYTAYRGCAGLHEEELTGAKATQISVTDKNTDGDPLTLKDALLSYFDDEDYAVVSEVDRFNIAVNSASKYKHNFAYIIRPVSLWGTRLWYEYELYFPANSEVENSVTVPLYPTIGTRYKAHTYGYSYLLSPAASWAAFGELTININCPLDNGTGRYYMTGANLVFSEKAGGYTCTFTPKTVNGKPALEDMYFSLCGVEKPSESGYTASYDYGYYSAVSDEEVRAAKVLFSLAAVFAGGGLIAMTFILIFFKPKEKK